MFGFGRKKKREKEAARKASEERYEETLEMRADAREKTVRYDSLKRTRSVETKLFGEVEYEPEKKLFFANGLLAPSWHEAVDSVDWSLLCNFLLLRDIDGSRVSFLQSLDQPEIAVPVVDPLEIDAGYNPAVMIEELDDIGDTEDTGWMEESLLVLVVMDLNTGNINGDEPILINVENQRGMQIRVKEDDEEQPE